VSRSAAIQDPVEIGIVARPHGVRGELRIALHNPDSDALDRAEAVTIGGRSYEVESARPTNGAYLLCLVGVDDRDQADTLRGQRVAVTRDALDLDEDDVLLGDLVGCRVERVDGTAWGVIARVDTGPQNRLVIQDGAVERQLPITDEFVVEVDLENRRVVVDPPEGLPEDPIG
jgi:16S rRNA processing protein RimM